MKRNWDACVQMYEKAIEYLPTHGLPHNQLGVVAHTNDKMLRSVYYYVRALSCAHHFPHARENMKVVLKLAQLKRPLHPVPSHSIPAFEAVFLDLFIELAGLQSLEPGDERSREDKLEAFMLAFPPLVHKGVLRNELLLQIIVLLIYVQTKPNFLMEDTRAMHMVDEDETAMQALVKVLQTVRIVLIAFLLDSYCSSVLTPLFLITT